LKVENNRHLDLDQSKRTGPSISVTGVSHIYKRTGKAVAALEDFNFEIQAGEFTAVVGPSGCGKSTLLLIVAGLLRPSSGEVRIGDEPVTGPQTDVGIVFQDPGLLEWRTSLKNILIQAEARKMDKKLARAYAKRLMAMMKLEGFEDAYPSELSGGMKQRISICRALLHDPPLLLMDEPFGALDALTREQMAIDMQALWIENPKSVLFITHDINEAVFLADRVMVLSDRPARVLTTIEVNLPRPRRLATLEDPMFTHLAGTIREALRREGVLEE
jgi:NitT/TauT family transport system ATP-binding protein